MDYVYEEDMQIAVASLKKEQSEIEVDKLCQLLNKLGKKFEEMSDVWQTEQAMVDRKEIQKMLEKIRIDELYAVIDSIKEIDVRYDFDMLQMN